MEKGNRVKVSSKAEINKPAPEDMDLFSTRLRIPAHIREELEKEGLVARFISVKKIQDSGGYHPMGWVPYEIKNPKPNPITGQAEKVHRVGDLILAVKSKQDAAKHEAHLNQKAASLKKSNKGTIQDMRDRIKESGANKHVALFEGYDENGDDE